MIIIPTNIFHNNLYSPTIIPCYIFSNSFSSRNIQSKVHWIQHNPSRPWSIFDSPQELYIIIYYLFSWLLVHYIYMFLLTSFNHSFSTTKSMVLPWSPDQTSVVASFVKSPRHERTIISRRPNRWLNPPLAALPRRIPR